MDVQEYLVLAVPIFGAILLAWVTGGWRKYGHHLERLGWWTSRIRCQTAPRPAGEAAGGHRGRGGAPPASACPHTTR